jgi:hypothetical protein
MGMTLDQIVEESCRLPRQQMAELVDKLTLSLHQAMEPRLESAWKETVSARVAEIRSGNVEGIPGVGVSERIGEIVGR